MAEKIFRVLLDFSGVNSSKLNYVWTTISPRETRTVGDFKQVLLKKFDISSGEIDLFLNDGLLLDGETIRILREDDTVRVEDKPSANENYSTFYVRRVTSTPLDAKEQDDSTNQIAAVSKKRKRHSFAPETEHGNAGKTKRMKRKSADNDASHEPHSDERLEDSNDIERVINASKNAPKNHKKKRTKSLNDSLLGENRECVRSDPSYTQNSRDEAYPHDSLPEENSEPSYSQNSRSKAYLRVSLPEENSECVRSEPFYTQTSKAYSRGSLPEENNECVRSEPSYTQTSRGKAYSRGSLPEENSECVRSEPSYTRKSRSKAYSFGSLPEENSECVRSEPVYTHNSKDKAYTPEENSDCVRSDPSYFQKSNSKAYPLEENSECVRIEPSYIQDKVYPQDSSEHVSTITVKQKLFDFSTPMEAIDISEHQSSKSKRKSSKLHKRGKELFEPSLPSEVIDVFQQETLKNNKKSHKSQNVIGESVSSTLPGKENGFEEQIVKNNSSMFRKKDLREQDQWASKSVSNNSQNTNISSYSYLDTSSSYTTAQTSKESMEVATENAGKDSKFSVAEKESNSGVFTAGQGNNCKKKKKRKRHKKRKQPLCNKLSGLSLSNEAEEFGNNSNFLEKIYSDVRSTSCAGINEQKLNSPLKQNLLTSYQSGLSSEHVTKDSETSVDTCMSVVSPSSRSVHQISEACYSNQREIKTPLIRAVKFFPQSGQEVSPQSSNNSKNVSGSYISSPDAKICDGNSVQHEEIPIENYPELKTLPLLGSYIAFKILELDETYSPIVSAYKKGVIKEINQNETLTIELAEPEVKRKGKFENIYDNDVSETVNSCVTAWSSLIEPRLISKCGVQTNL